MKVTIRPQSHHGAKGNDEKTVEPASGNSVWCHGVMNAAFLIRNLKRGFHHGTLSDAGYMQALDLVFLKLPLTRGSGIYMLFQ